MNIVNNVDKMIGNWRLTLLRVMIIVGHGENWGDEGQGSDDRDDLELHG